LNFWLGCLNMKCSFQLFFRMKKKNPKKVQAALQGLTTVSLCDLLRNLF
jgi:hypothetical protein